jgi:hypothetical protein
VDSQGRTIFVADAHRDDGKRYVVHADEKLTAFIELESAIRACGEQPVRHDWIKMNSKMRSFMLASFLSSSYELLL